MASGSSQGGEAHSQRLRPSGRACRTRIKAARAVGRRRLGSRLRASGASLAAAGSLRLKFSRASIPAAAAEAGVGIADILRLQFLHQQALYQMALKTLRHSLGLRLALGLGAHHFDGRLHAACVLALMRSPPNARAPLGIGAAAGLLRCCRLLIPAGPQALADNLHERLAALKCPPEQPAEQLCVARGGGAPDRHHDAASQASCHQRLSLGMIRAAPAATRPTP